MVAAASGADDWVVRLGSAAVLLAVLLAVWYAALDPHEDDGSADGWRTECVAPDKVLHFGGGYALCWTLIPVVGGPWAALLAALTGVGWELQQRFPHRRRPTAKRTGARPRGVFSWRDAVATAAGAAAALAWAHAWGPR